MIIDSSALLAVLYREPDAERYEESMAASGCRLSVANALEVATVVEARGGMEAGQELDAFLSSAGIELVPMTAEHLAAARRAWGRFGKGRHPAALNFGVSFAYALADVTGEPLLFKGGDFARTDIRAALPANGDADA